MAYEETLRSVTLDADSSIGIYTGVPGTPGSASPNSGRQYRFVKVVGSHQAGLSTAAANEITVGVLQNKPQGVGHAATVATHGISLVQCGGTVNAGNAVKTDANGQALAATLPADAALVLGVCVIGAGNGQLASVLLRLN